MPIDSDNVCLASRTGSCGAHRRRGRHEVWPAHERAGSDWAEIRPDALRGRRPGLSLSKVGDDMSDAARQLYRQFGITLQPYMRCDEMETCCEDTIAPDGIARRRHDGLTLRVPIASDRYSRAASAELSFRYQPEKLRCRANWGR